MNEPIKGSHYAMEPTGKKHEAKGREYRCPVCGSAMYYSEAKRHEHK